MDDLDLEKASKEELELFNLQLDLNKETGNLLRQKARIRAIKLDHAETIAKQEGAVKTIEMRIQAIEEAIEEKKAELEG